MNLRINFKKVAAGTAAGTAFLLVLIAGWTWFHPAKIVCVRVTGDGSTQYAIDKDCDIK